MTRGKEKLLRVFRRKVTQGDVVGPELDRWGESKRDTGALERALEASEGPTEEWFAALDRRIETAGDDDGYGSPFSNDGVRAVTGLHNSVRLQVRPNHPWPSRPARGAEIPKAVERAVVKARPRGPRRRAVARFFSRRTWLLVCSVVALAAGGAVAVVAGHYLVALALVVAAAGLDLLEGALGRLSGSESPKGRWFAAVGSHLGDVAVIAGIAIAQLRDGHTAIGAVLFIAALCGLFGSLARTLAREVGRVLWQPSFAERAIRLAATTGYLMLSLEATGDTAHRLAPWFSAVLFGGFGLWEVLRVGLALRHDDGEDSVLVRGPRHTAAYVPLALVATVSPGPTTTAAPGDDGDDGGGPPIPAPR